MQTSDEQWRPVVGYEGLYEVSDQGRIRSLDRFIDCADGRRRHFHGKELTPNRLASGHLSVDLGKQNRRGLRVHRMVLEAFVGPCPEGMEACHANDVPDDNRLVNLRWDTKSANRHDAVRNGRNLNANKTHCKRGHEFTPENTKDRGGRRECRACMKIHARNWAERRSN